MSTGKNLEIEYLRAIAVLMTCVSHLPQLLPFHNDRNPFGTPFSTYAAFFRRDALMWGILIFLFSRSAQYQLFEPTFLRGAPHAA